MKKYLLIFLSLFIATGVLAEDIPFGSTSVKLQMVVRDSTTGALKTGLTNATSGLALSARPDNAATVTAYTVAASNVETIATLGTYAAPTASKIRFKEIDATYQPGVYEIQAADALFSTANARTLTFDIIGTGITADPLKLVFTADAATVIWGNAGGELSACPTASANKGDQLQYLFMSARNQLEQPALGPWVLRKDDATTALCSKTVTTGATFKLGEAQ